MLYGATPTQYFFLFSISYNEFVLRQGNAEIEIDRGAYIYDFVHIPGGLTNDTHTHTHKVVLFINLSNSLNAI